MNMSVLLGFPNSANPREKCNIRAVYISSVDTTDDH